MPFELILLLAGTLITLGSIGILCRRNLIAIFLSAHISFLGILLLFAAFSTFFSDAKGVFIAVLFIFLFSIQIMLTSALVILVFRNQGTLNIDEMRKLRG